MEKFGLNGKLRMGDTMEFDFRTIYGQKALTVMAKTLRKTVRKRHSRRSHVFGWIVTILALLLVLPIGGREVVINLRTIVTWIAIAAIILALLFEDHMNGYIARKRLLKGISESFCRFTEEGYYSEVGIGKSEWKYDNIEAIAETKDYFVFIFDASHAQLYDKKSINGGTVEEFRRFITEKTGKTVQMIK